MKAERGDEALRRFRVSQPDTDYFITANLADKPHGVLRPATKDAIRREAEMIEAANHWKIRAAVIMPDHFHLWITLGDNLDLSRVMARLKAKTRAALLKEGLRWQPNFYEHRLRANENPAAMLRYIYLNPYRAGLIAPADTYPWYWIGLAEAAWFDPQTDDGGPSPEWLR